MENAMPEPSKTYLVGENIAVKNGGKTVTLTLDLTEAGRLSGSGKNMTIATTGSAQVIGNTPDGRPVKLNLTAYASLPA
jgi:hypothetical protein